MNVPLLDPRDRLRLRVALDWFHTGHEHHSGIDWIVARDRRDHPVRMALASKTLEAWLLTEEGWQVAIPPELWMGKFLWSEAYSSALVKVRIADHVVAGYLVVARDAFTAWVGADDADAITQPPPAPPAPSLPSPSPAACMSRSDAELSPYLRLMIDFSHARADLFGARRPLKKEVMAWFAENWPGEMESDWPVADRKLALDTDQKWPRFVQEMAGLVFMRREDRKGGKQKGLVPRRRRRT